MELSTAEAGALIGLSDEAIRNHIAAGRLPARREGIRQTYRISVADLREFARQYSYTLDEDALANLA